LGKNVCNKPVSLEFMDIFAVKRGYSGTFLSPVLEGIQGIIELD
jgi:hypothetical protein